VGAGAIEAHRLERYMASEDPTLSAGKKSGKVRWKSSTRALVPLAIAIPAGLRSHTPIRHGIEAKRGDGIPFRPGN